jgi:putative oxidoreductase
MIDATTAPYAILLLRWCLGAMFIAHALLKVRVFTIPGTVRFFQSLGLPGWVAYVTIAVAFGGAAALMLGLWPRIAALLLVPLIAGTIVTVHGKKGWLFSNPDGVKGPGWYWSGGGIEYLVFWGLASLIVFSHEWRKAPGLLGLFK